VGVEVVPDVGAAEQELRVRRQAGVPPTEPWAEHVGEQPVVDPGVGIAAEVRDQADHVVDVIRERSGAAVRSALPILVSRVHMQPGSSNQPRSEAFALARSVPHRTPKPLLKRTELLS
jgi:hypothetical protein